MLYFVSFNFLCMLFVLIYLKKNRKQLFVILCMTGWLYGFWQSQKVWYFHYLTQRQVDKFGFFCHSRWRPNPKSQFCTQVWGSSVDHFLITEGKPKPLPLGLTSP